MATLTADERQARRDTDRAKSIEAVHQLQTSDGWQNWLRVRRHFHRYSLHNQLLIAMQKPDATRVAGFRAWLKLGYCVRKGETALRIWVPIKPTRKQLEDAARNGDPRPKTFFKLGPVFDRSQIQPLPPPAEPVPLDPPIVDIEGNELLSLLDEDGPIQALAASLNIDYGYTNGEHTANGWYEPAANRIRIVAAGRSINAQVATAIHELAHALVRIERHDDDPTLDYATEELVVESVAYTVTGALGIDIAGYAIPYLASWAKEDINIIEQHAKLIDRLATRLEDALIPKDTP